MVSAAEREIERLEIILDQIGRIETRLASVAFTEFAADADLSDLIAFRVQTIGENCHRLSSPLKRRHALPWIDIYGMRNIISHDYARISPAAVWAVAMDHLGSIRVMAEIELARSLSAADSAV